MKPRRSRAQLEAAIENAGTDRERARAHYNLALFHDNNVRELEAISDYQRALKLGLPARLRGEALAWLASSFYKTGKPRDAKKSLALSRRQCREPKLRRFLDGLERRIDRR
jgi:hypothetical protein